MDFLGGVNIYEMFYPLLSLIVQIALSLTNIADFTSCTGKLINDIRLNRFR